LRPPRPEVAYSNSVYYVTLTFYIGSNDTARVQEIFLDALQASNVSSAVFFLQPGFAEANHALASAMQQRG
jgi:hypothetical protein